uniref:hydroquinone glucosyltransferase-like n=1 Tax=Erigeron canadensis TaxID=72917 RepID=UPI001CB8BAF3|nr:hydroquinone glucosyltransferase-like [Erigeron canadensis]
MAKTPHIAILPSPGMGHLIPMAEFAKRLAEHHHISATILIPTTGAPPQAQISVLESLPENIHHLFLPPVDGVPQGVRPEIIISFIMKASHSSVQDAIRSLKANTNLVGLVFDMFGHDAIEVAKEFDLFKFLFFPMSAMALSFTFILPKLDEESSCEYKDLPYLVHVPGSVSFHGKELMAPVQVRTDDVYKGYLLLSKRLSMFDGIMVNSFDELEEETFRVLRASVAGKTPIYSIGPLIQSVDNGSDRHECLKWLDNQPNGSVVFVCFGSGGTLTLDQVHELAHGLEMSNQRFLWVVRSPSKASNANFFNAVSQDDPLGFLPKKFLANTVKKGLVVSSWAPQIEILSHEATGGFLTHCGWNSTLESVVHGVPMIAWPLYAEQHMNAKVMTEALGLALKVETDDKGIITKEVIGKVVKELIEGDEGKKVSKRLEHLKGAAMKALSNGGSSMESLSKFVQQLKKTSFL